MSDADNPTVATGTTETVDTDFLRGPRRDILEALTIIGGQGTSSAITEVTDVPSGSMQHHLLRLGDRGYVAHTDDIETPSGQFAWVWEITDAGETALAEYDDRGAALVTTTDLEARIEELESQVERLDAAVDELTPDTGYEV